MCECSVKTFHLLKKTPCIPRTLHYARAQYKQTCVLKMIMEAKLTLKQNIMYR